MERFLWDNTECQVRSGGGGEMHFGFNESRGNKRKEQQLKITVITIKFSLQNIQYVLLKILKCSF